MKVDIGNMKSMLSVVNSIVGTKPACHLSESERHHISVLVIKAFLHSLPSNATKGSSKTITAPVPVQIMTCEGDSVKDSKLLSGVLLQAPDIPTFQHQSRTLVNHTSKVALFNISMAGDTVEWFSDNIKMETTGHDVVMANATLQRILKVADWLVANGVEVIACQKCMHPALKRYLKDKGAFVVDRLSILHISAVQRLTGAVTLSTFSMDIPESSFGEVEKIEHVVFNEKSYLQLQSSSSAVCTLLLCSSDETSLEELKTVCQAAVIALHETLACPYLVPGAGCLDTHLASFLREYGQSSGSKIAEELGCTKGQFVATINSIAHCLESLARSLEHDGGGHVTDAANQHHWSLPPAAVKLNPAMPCCMCGLVSCDQSMEWNMLGDTESFYSQDMYCRRNCCISTNAMERVFENSVVDMFSMKMNSYRTAFETASAILRVHCVVCSSSADG